MSFQRHVEEKMQIPTYIGETSRSGYEESYKHLNDLDMLSSKSVLLRLVLSVHEGRDMAEIKLGMNIVSYNHTAFERQLEVAVRI